MSPGQTRRQLSVLISVSPEPFAHERMEVYREALDLVAYCHALVERFPRGRSSLVDQLERAAMSVALNTAEAIGEYAPREKVRLLRIGRRSANECAAVLDIAHRTSLVSESDLARAKRMLTGIAAMQTALIHHHERAGRPREGEA